MSKVRKSEPKLCPRPAAAMFGEADDPRRHPDRMETIAKRYWMAGFFFLPWLWVVNYLYFKDWLKMRHTPASVRWCAYLSRDPILPVIADVRFSLVGSFFYFALAIAWFGLYLTKRAEWGAKGDAISLLIPKGY